MRAMNEENDIHIEADENLDDSVLAEESQGASIKKLKDKLKAAEEKAKEHLDGWQRSQADFANLRRRDEEAKLEFLKFANQSLIEELIPVLDSFTIAVSNGHKELEPIYKQLLSVLKSKGLEELDPLGAPFDPRSHEAIGMDKVKEKERDHTVTQVLQKGYSLGGKVIRAAKVKIGEYKD
jgi:molecular chaperone GrpE